MKALFILFLFVQLDRSVFACLFSVVDFLCVPVECKSVVFLSFKAF